MMYYLHSVCLVLLGLTVVNCFEFPADITRCKVSDDACLLKTANGLLAANAKLGHTGISLNPLDPLELPSIYIKPGVESPVNIDLKIRKTSLQGLSQYEFTKISGFKREVDGGYEMRLTGPAVHLVGSYEISGRVLVLPIQGTGDLNIKLQSPEINIKFDGKSDPRNGEEYMKIENFRLLLNTVRVVFTFDNLFNGDQTLGRDTNQFLNDNWRDIFDEIKKPIYDGISAAAERTLTKMMNEVPYKDLFV